MIKFYKLINRIFFKKLRPSIGIELDSTRIRAIELKGVLNNLQLISCHRIELPFKAISFGEIVNKELLVKELGKLVEKNGWYGKQVVTALWDRRLVIRHVKMPLMPEKELKEAIKFELETFSPLAEEEMVLDYVNYGLLNGQKDKQSLLMLVAAPKKTVLDYYEVFSTAGLELVAIDIIPLALKRALTLEKNERVMAFTHLGAEMSTFFILEDNKISFVRNIAKDSNLAKLVEPVLNQKDLQIDDTELLKELRRCLNYWQAQNQNRKVDKLFVTGNIENFSSIIGLLTQDLEITVEVGRPLKDLLNKDQILSPDYAIAAGLALRGVEVSDFN